MSAQIIPAILPATHAQLESDFVKVHALATSHNKIHVDVADGIFVPHTTYPLHRSDTFTEVDCLPHGDTSGAVHFSVHCMVAHPERVVPMYIRAGASEVIIHIESFHSLESLETCCAMWNVHNVKVTLAVLLHTSISRLVHAMEVTHIDRVLLMSITSPGRQGALFDRHVLTHIREVKRLYPSAHISVDGGLNAETIGEVLAEGVDACVVGSHIMNAKDMQEVYERLVKISMLY
jgi:ribulose-phosphate 3-epimerase